MSDPVPWPQSPEDLTAEQADLVKKLRFQCTWRKLSEEFCDYVSPAKTPRFYGNQSHGEDLCRFARLKLGESQDEEPWP